MKMKKTIRSVISLLLALAMFAIPLTGLPAYAARNENYPTPIRGYTLATDNHTATVYSESACKNAVGFIYTWDDCIIQEISTNGIVKVVAPWSGYPNGRTVYTSLSYFFANTSSVYQLKAVSRTKCYNEKSLKSSPGAVYANDICYVVGENGNYYQVLCPWSGGYHRLVWVGKEAFGSPSSKNYPTPIRGYTLATDNHTATVYSESTCKNAVGFIYTWDDCIIQEISTSGIVKVVAPWSGYPNGRTVYTSLSYFFANTSSVYQLKAVNRTKCYNEKSLKSSPGAVYANDICYVVGENGSYYQVLCPWSGGYYRLVWVSKDAFGTTQSNPVGSTNGLVVSDSELSAAASRYSISTDNLAYKALQSINETYGEKLTQSQRDGNLVFLFEGVGTSSSSSARMNAMCVVIQNHKVKYISRNCSTIPDYPFNPQRNEGTDMPTIKAGIYNFTTTDHKGYAALNVSNAQVLRFKSQTSYYSSTSYGINVHRRSTDSIAPASASWVNSAGCILIGKSGTSPSGEYAQFIQSVGIVPSGSYGNVPHTGNVSGKIIIDRSYAANYLSNVGYPSGAISYLK